jgi:hypothetical protein
MAWCFVKHRDNFTFTFYKEKSSSEFYSSNVQKLWFNKEELQSVCSMSNSSNCFGKTIAFHPTAYSENICSYLETYKTFLGCQGKAQNLFCLTWLARTQCTLSKNCLGWLQTKYSIQQRKLSFCLLQPQSSISLSLSLSECSLIIRGTSGRSFLPEGAGLPFK